MNELQLASSLYLQQHKNNPVHWRMWSQTVWKEARRSNKLVVISIGYSSCHWCHVMERESFEQEDVADVMNAHFLCIKVDREERPDIDHLYMTAVQLMTGKGGWPLNVVCLPDQRPIWGGTYFPRDTWTHNLLELHKMHRSHPEKVVAYAEKMEKGLRASQLIPAEKTLRDDRWLRERLLHTAEKRDNRWGGYGQAPKFPMPTENLFLLMAAEHYDVPKLTNNVHITLQRLAMGGIHDVIGGGFSRYTVDVRWKIPHFEKMLYDNALLLSTYAIAQRRQPNDLYVQAIKGIWSFVHDTLRTKEGLYCSAVDADSEGVEGMYYTWSQEEIRSATSEHYPLWASIYNLEEPWEDGRCILFRTESYEVLAEKHNMDTTTLQSILEEGRKILLVKRQQRIHPAIDTKILMGWNAMLIRGFCDAYLALNEPAFLKDAEDLMEGLCTHLQQGGQWFRVRANGKTYIPAMLEDFAALASAALDLFSLTGKDAYHILAKEVANHVLEHFTDLNGSFFFTTDNRIDALLTKAHELEDNVIPSPNAVMADVLRRLCTIEYSEELQQRWTNMVGQAAALSKEIRFGFFQWGMTYLRSFHSNIEWVVTGDHAAEEWRKIALDFHDFFTDVYVLTHPKQETLFVHRYQPEIKHFVCMGTECHPPVNEADDALRLVKSAKERLS